MSQLLVRLSHQKKTLSMNADWKMLKMFRVAQHNTPLINLQNFGLTVANNQFVLWINKQTL